MFRRWNRFQTSKIAASSIVAGVSAILIVIIMAGIVVAEESPTLEVSEGEKLFALHVQDLFAAKCNACHGADPDALEGGLNMLSREDTLIGGDSFGDEVLVPGDAAASYLYQVVTRQLQDYEMPPKESEALSQQQQWQIRDWINAGAPWPNVDKVKQIRAAYADGEVVPTSGGLDDQWTNRRYETQKLWAYRPLQPVAVKDDAHLIDFFIDGRIDAFNAANGSAIVPAGDADATTMLRRLTFGLTGLPPTAQQVKAYSI
ncbi:MAG: c-type cytochrome domain-containing protein, partial [Planctomycetota bacterium]